MEDGAGPSDNQVSKPTNLNLAIESQPQVIHVNLEDEVKCDDKQDDEICDKDKKGSVSVVWDYFGRILGCPRDKEKAKYEVKVVENSFEVLDLDDD